MDLLLPIPAERADAARNRRLVLEAFERLCARDGIENVSMDAVAAEAGVGKGTIYRRFGDRAGLALALLDEDERRLQEAVLRGQPPLGPGSPPVERTVAFVRALGALIERRLDVLLSAGGWFGTQVYAAWRAHLSLLCDEERADAILALCAPQAHAARRRHVSRRRRLDELERATRALLRQRRKRPATTAASQGRSPA
jgi:AcrR family transcriptional regulator